MKLKLWSYPDGFVSFGVSFSKVLGAPVVFVDIAWFTIAIELSPQLADCN